jgi:hypothetical protein
MSTPRDEGPSPELLHRLEQAWGEAWVMSHVPKATDVPPFGPWVRARRIGLRLPIVEAAARAGMSPTMWQEIEQGQRDPAPAVAIAMARTLGTSLPATPHR